jgi:hypothetical protein
MSRSCVCGGNNDNCRYCNGLGTIPDRLASALIEHAQRTDAVRAATESFRVGGRSLATQRPQPGLVPCSVQGCSAKLNPRRLQKHIKKVHDKPRLLPSQAPAKSKAHQVNRQAQPNSAPQLIPCPVSGCSAKVKPSRVDLHLVRAHRQWRMSKVATPPSFAGSSSESRAAAAARYIISNSISDVTQRNSSHGHYPEGNLDATKGYAHAYREVGRFGSHPSHDAFDDDSGPE